MKLKSENLTNAEAFGLESQIIQAIEEMSELTQGLTKFIRYYLHAPEADAEKVAKIHQNIEEEIADVEIMTEQLKFLLGIPDERVEEVKRYKIMRTTLRRLGKDDNHD